jgi:hypothetical protein
MQDCDSHDDPARLAHAQLHQSWMRHMRTGNWRAAWRLSDEVLRRRSGAESGSAHLQRHLQPIWDGASLEGKRVLVRCYHGLGDTVQFIRFAPMLRKIASRTIVWAQPHLLPLLETARGIDTLIPLHDGDIDVERDAQIELMELPHVLRVTPDTIPGEVPYFDIRPTSRGASDRPAVGIVWRAGSWDPRRSIDPALIAELTRVRGVDWRIFPRREPRESPCVVPGTSPVFRDILEEAQAMRHLDLLISVDTFAAHLAGALAVPTWTLIQADADWRWMQDRDDTPWYPTMRLFRQREQGNWREVLERVSRALLRRLSGERCSS